MYEIGLTVGIVLMGFTAFSLIKRAKTKADLGCIVMMILIMFIAISELI